MDNKDLSIVQAGLSAGLTGAGAAVGSVLPGVGTALGTVIGGATGGVLSAGLELFKEPEKPKVSGSALAQESMARLSVVNAPQSLTPSELSAIASREIAELNAVQADIVTATSNPNIPASMVQSSANSAFNGLRNIIRTQNNVKASTEFEAIKARASEKTTNLALYADIAAKNNAVVLEAEAMYQQMRSAQWQNLGVSAASGTKAVVTTLEAQELEKQAAADKAAVIKALSKNNE